MRSIQRVRVVSDPTIAFESGTRVIPEIGMVALPAGQRVKVIVDVSRPGWLESLRRWLPPVVTHELCHIVRVRVFLGSVDPTMPPPPDSKPMSVESFMAWNLGRPPTLGDFVIHEGLADHFAMEVFGGGPYPWDKAIEREQLDRWLATFSSIGRTGTTKYPLGWSAPMRFPVKQPTRWAIGLSRTTWLRTPATDRRT